VLIMCVLIRKCSSVGQTTRQQSKWAILYIVRTRIFFPTKLVSSLTCIMHLDCFCSVRAASLFSLHINTLQKAIPGRNWCSKGNQLGCAHSTSSTASNSVNKIAPTPHLTSQKNYDTDPRPEILNNRKRIVGVEPA